MVLGQVEVGAKSNEIPMFAPLLDSLAGAGVDLTRTVITALRTQRAHAHYPHERGAEFVFTAKHNQPRLYAALDSLPWAEVPSPFATSTPATDGSSPAPSRCYPAPADLPFPHVNQIWLIERFRRVRANGGVWAPSFFLLRDVDTWQLIINTLTTIVTFLLVALLQNTQKCADEATQHKLNAIADGLADLMN